MRSFFWTPSSNLLSSFFFFWFLDGALFGSALFRFDVCKFPFFPGSVVLQESPSIFLGGLQPCFPFFRSLVLWHARFFPQYTFRSFFACYAYFSLVSRNSCPFWLPFPLPRLRFFFRLTERILLSGLTPDFFRRVGHRFGLTRSAFPGHPFYPFLMQQNELPCGSFSFMYKSLLDYTVRPFSPAGVLFVLTYRARLTRPSETPGPEESHFPPTHFLDSFFR